MLWFWSLFPLHLWGDLSKKVCERLPAVCRRYKLGLSHLRCKTPVNHKKTAKKCWKKLFDTRWLHSRDFPAHKWYWWAFKKVDGHWKNNNFADQSINFLLLSMIFCYTHTILAWLYLYVLTLTTVNTQDEIRVGWKKRWQLLRISQICHTEQDCCLYPITTESNKKKAFCVL